MQTSQRPAFKYHQMEVPKEKNETLARRRGQSLAWLVHDTFGHLGENRTCPMGVFGWTPMSTEPKNWLLVNKTINVWIPAVFVNELMRA
jgi:hypothetical protein